MIKKVNSSKMPHFDIFFLFWKVNNVKKDFMVIVKMATLCSKCIL